MKYIASILFLFIALNTKANEEFNTFQQTKTKQIDSLSTVYLENVKLAQKNYDEALLKADKKYTDALKKIEDAELKLLEKIKIIEPEK